MFSVTTRYKDRIKELNEALEIARQQLAAIELLQRDRACLISITREDRINRFTFVRNGQLTTIETYSMMDDNVTGWKRDLLEPIA